MGAEGLLYAVVCGYPHVVTSSTTKAFSCTLRARFSDLHLNSILPLPTSRADLDHRQELVWARVGDGVRVRVRVRVLGLGWSGRRNHRFVRTCQWGAVIHKSVLNLCANLKILARTTSQGLIFDSRVTG